MRQNKILTMDTEKELIETIKKYHNEVIAGNINSYNSLKEAHAKAVEINNKECIVRSLSSLAWVNYIKGDLDLALSRYDEAISIAEKGDMPRALAAIYNNQALAYSRLGNRTLAISKFFKALELFAQLGVKSQEVNVLENVGCQYTDLGDLDKGEEYF